MRAPLCLALLLAPALAAAQAPAPPAAPALPRTLAPRPTTPAITAADLMTRLYIFADDSMMGREAGTLGNVKATDYLAAELKRLGLRPAGEDGSYFQQLPLKVRRIDEASTFVAGGASLALGTDWIFSGSRTISGEALPLVYGGLLGDTAAPLTDAQAQGKLVALRMPVSQAAIGAAIQQREVAPPSAAGVVILVPNQVRGLMGYFRQPSELVDDGSAISRLYVMEPAADRLFPRPLDSLQVGDAGAAVTVSALVQATPVEHPARNVVAILPGSDPVLRHQYVAIGAHSDHVGLSRRAFDHDSVRLFNRMVRPGGAEDQAKQATPEQQAAINAELAAWRAAGHAPRPDSIFNGADDDGSGSVAVLEVAEYLASLPVKPKRSTLFVWHVGEEKGLWGSAYFTEHPTVPRDSIVAQLNLDMVGRGFPTDQTGLTKDGEPLRGGTDYVQLVGSRRLSSELGNLVEAVNLQKRYNFRFDYAMDANGHPMNIYCRSDHYEYAKWNIPVTFFTTGGHSDYHQLTDEPQYINYPQMEKVARLVADIAVELGNRTARPVVDGPRMDPRGGCRQ
jgi:hypothetical protein